MRYVETHKETIRKLDSGVDVGFKVFDSLKQATWISGFISLFLFLFSPFMQKGLDDIERGLSAVSSSSSKSKKAMDALKEKLKKNSKR